MHGFKKPNVGAKLSKMGVKSANGGGDPTVMKKAKEKTIGMISGDLVKPRLDRPARASGGKCVGSKMSGDD